ncbi:MAG: hypothetical protein JWP59_4472, partial [Massilia sp.]|nr:hypothetical protein [Massilia sp.]
MIARMHLLSRALLAGLLLLLLFTGLNAHAQATRAADEPAAGVLRPQPPPDEEPPYNYSSFSSQSLPTTMTVGTAYTVTVSMYNSGTKTWSSSTSHALGSQNPIDNVTWSGARVGMAGDVAPGQTATFTFQVIAPSTPGNYNFQWQMVQDGVEWFGAMSTNLVINVVAPPRINAAVVLAQSVPAQMTAGQSYALRIVMQNTGNTTWTTADQYSFGIPATNGVQL